MPRRDGPPAGTAKDRALRLLAVRWRSRAELEQRLRLAGFEPDEIANALEDLERAGLVDDARFARAVVADRAGRRLSGDRDIRTALRQKGVAPDVADRAMEAAGAEADRARALARKRAARLTEVEPGVAFSRLYGALLRRGFGPAVAREACRTALAGAIGAAPQFEDEPTEG